MKTVVWRLLERERERECHKNVKPLFGGCVRLGLIQTDGRRDRRLDVGTFPVPAEGRVGAVQPILCNLRPGAAARSHCAVCFVITPLTAGTLSKLFFFFFPETNRREASTSTAVDPLQL